MKSIKKFKGVEVRFKSKDAIKGSIGIERIGEKGQANVDDVVIIPMNRKDYLEVHYHEDIEKDSVK